MEQRHKQMFAGSVRGARVSKGLTLDAVSKKVGAGKGYLSGIEAGKVNPPRPRILKKLCDTLDLNYIKMLTLRAVALAPEDLGLEDMKKVLNSL